MAELLSISLGFNYEFHNLKENGERNELNEAYKDMFSAEAAPSFFARLQFMIPILAYIVGHSNRMFTPGFAYVFEWPTEQTRRVARAQAVSRRIGLQLIREKKEALQAHANDEKRDVKRDDLQGRDLLSLLIKANMATDIPDSQKLSDDDVLAREFILSIFSNRYDLLNRFHRGPNVCFI